MSDAAVDQGRRTWIAITCGAGAVGGAAVAVPFVSTFAPSERARAAGAPVEVDISKLAPGDRMTVEWRGKPVWILRRTPDQIDQLKSLDGQLADPNSERTAYPIPEYAKNTGRSIKPEYLVVIGICTHLGCSPGGVAKGSGNASVPSDWPGGFLCPCHGSTFDLAGRVYKNKPAPDNLEVPPHMYLSDTVLLIGEDKKA
uniref:Ubiquinol-cytochrome c reductase iron-sulfur subunit n=1 Tax=Rubrivivax gelatinosus TaxID=28068 RepID=Q93SY7_RUBGE|nr:Rieske protein [Rubrivivax gelatinosus S1]